MTHEDRNSHHVGEEKVQPIGDTYPYPDKGWTCFHCGETFSIAKQRHYQGALDAAREHFGSGVCDEPLCKIATLPHAELVRRVRAAEESERAALTARDEADAQAEAAHSELSSLGSRFKGAKTVYDAWCMFDSMEGRALTAEAIIAFIECNYPVLVITAREEVCKPQERAA